MSDIVERLRNPPTGKDDNDEWFRFNETKALLDEAADEIERVRGLLEAHRESAKRAQALMLEQRAEIERLRSIAGNADLGPSFSELTDELRHQTPSESIAVAYRCGPPPPERD